VSGFSFRIRFITTGTDAPPNGSRPVDELAGQRGVGVQCAGDAEVDDAGAVGAHQDVLRLEVAVHDAGAVDGGERGHRADRQPVQVGAGPGALAGHELAQRRAGDVLADDVGPVAVHVGRQHLGRAEAGDTLEERELADEAGAGVGAGQHRGVQELDRDLVVPGPAEVHHALAAGAQPGGDLVPAQPSGIGRAQRKSHRAPPLRKYAQLTRHKTGPRGIKEYRFDRPRAGDKHAGDQF
jgi:hypothetical protein